MAQCLSTTTKKLFCSEVFANKKAFLLCPVCQKKKALRTCLSTRKAILLRHVCQQKRALFFFDTFVKNANDDLTQMQFVVLLSWVYDDPVLLKRAGAIVRLMLIVLPLEVFV
jgi:hypothetical protein